MLLNLVYEKDQEVVSIFEKHLSFLQASNGKYGRYQGKD